MYTSKVFMDGSSTIVVLSQEIVLGKNKVLVEAGGSARRNSADAPNPEVGLAIATARAENNLRVKRDALKAKYAKRLQYVKT